MNYKKITAVFLALGMTMMCFSGCWADRRIHTSSYKLHQVRQPQQLQLQKQLPRQRLRQPLHRNLPIQVLRTVPVHSPEAAVPHRQEIIRVILHQETKQRKNMKRSMSVEM